MKHVAIALALVSLSANADLKMATKPQPIYLGSDGKQLDPIDAIKRSIKGEKVLKCDQVEAQASATGNVSMKKVK
jgi:hypothetical protein